jgi:hypothetical protein
MHTTRTALDVAVFAYVALSLIGWTLLRAIFWT